MASFFAPSPRSYKTTGLILLAMILLAVLFTNCSAKEESQSPNNNDQNTDPTPVFSRLTVNGHAVESGVFDPAVEYDNNVGWMTYSWVKWPDEVVTHLAKTINGGETWTYQQELNARTTQTINGDVYFWRHETSTIIYDPTDVASKRWKVYYQSVPAKVSTCTAGGCPTRHDLSAIFYRYASSPDGSWSAPVCLFGQVAAGCSIHINTLNASLSGNAGYNELGSLVKDGVIYMSMDSFTTPDALGDWQNRKVILLKSTDHGANWSYVGVLTDYDDATPSSHIGFTATSLTRKGGKDYLLLSPLESGVGHDGTWVVEFSDISQAELMRNGNGDLIVTKKIDFTKSNGGESDYDENNSAGMLFPQLDNSLAPAGEFFQIYNVTNAF